MSRCVAILLLLALPSGAAAEAEPGAGKQGFASRCESDGQCLEGVCRNVSAELRICTRLCTQSSECPETVPCEKGLCVASEAILRSQSCSGSSCPSGEETIEGGCSVGGRAGCPASLAGLVLAWLLLARKRDRRPEVARRAARV